MTTTWLRHLTVLALALGLSAHAGTLGAHQTKKGDPTSASGFNGTWTMTIDSHQGTMPATLTIKLDGRKVTGTFSSLHGDLPIDGELTNGTLTFGADVKDPDHQGHLTFKASLKDDGTLAGTVTSPMGDMSWSAQRAK